MNRVAYLERLRAAEMEHAAALMSSLGRDRPSAPGAAPVAASSQPRLSRSPMTANEFLLMQLDEGARSSFARKSQGADDADDMIPARFSQNDRKRAVAFPLKLMEILSEQRYSHIISWMPNGKSFVVLRPKAFVAEVLPQNFKSAQYASFTRKLTRWGFLRCEDGTGEFYHPQFRRGRIDLAEQITPCHDATTKAVKEKIVAIEKNREEARASSPATAALSDDEDGASSATAISVEDNVDSTVEATTPAARKVSPPSSPPLTADRGIMKKVVSPPTVSPKKNLIKMKHIAGKERTSPARGPSTADMFMAAHKAKQQQRLKATRVHKAMQDQQRMAMAAAAISPSMGLLPMSLHRSPAALHLLSPGMASLRQQQASIQSSIQMEIALLEARAQNDLALGRRLAALKGGAGTTSPDLRS